MTCAQVPVDPAYERHPQLAGWLEHGQVRGRIWVSWGGAEAHWRWEGVAPKEVVKWGCSRVGGGPGQGVGSRGGSSRAERVGSSNPTIMPAKLQSHFSWSNGPPEDPQTGTS